MTGNCRSPGLNYLDPRGRLKSNTHIKTWDMCLLAAKIITDYIEVETKTKQYGRSHLQMSK